MLNMLNLALNADKAHDKRAALVEKNRHKSRQNWIDNLEQDANHVGVSVWRTTDIQLLKMVGRWLLPRQGAHSVFDDPASSSIVLKENGMNWYPLPS
jgi:hypothetical protein